MTWISNLKQIMTEKQINIEGLKNKISQNGHSLSRNSIGNILNERNSPKFDTMQIIADALEIDLSELFSSPNSAINSEVAEIVGFIDFAGDLYRIKSREELKNLYVKVYGTDLVSNKEENVVIIENQQADSGRPLLARARNKRTLNRFQRRVFDRYNVTVGTRKELEYPNNLPRDVKIWIFSSKQDELQARTTLHRLLKFSFNA
ncbi:helix-turn-helix domain-containing protein [Maribellus sediminis]|uniref:helix-turn-helix domain-containing protein n=1 Tax=Maribellus sediminis TaxID=2696285 RepID=UPI001431B11F|nr:helix-turn-helix transcriptional regulator [Maribellus sediminis]